MTAPVCLSPTPKRRRLREHPLKFSLKSSSHIRVLCQFTVNHFNRCGCGTKLFQAVENFNGWRILSPRSTTVSKDQSQHPGLQRAREAIRRGQPLNQCGWGCRKQSRSAKKEFCPAPNRCQPTMHKMPTMQKTTFYVTPHFSALAFPTLLKQLEPRQFLTGKQQQT